MAILSHTPMSEEGARDKNKQVRDLVSDLKATLRAVDKINLFKGKVESSFQVELEPGETMSQILGSSKG